MRAFILFLVCLLATNASSQVPTISNLNSTKNDVGIPIGQKLPQFAARDQFGKEQNLSTLFGREGLVLLFVRSADW